MCSSEKLLRSQNRPCCWMSVVWCQLWDLGPASGKSLKALHHDAQRWTLLYKGAHQIVKQHEQFSGIQFNSTPFWDLFSTTHRQTTMRGCLHILKNRWLQIASMIQVTWWNAKLEKIQFNFRGVVWGHILVFGKEHKEHRSRTNPAWEAR